MCFIFFQVARRSDVVVLPLDLRIVLLWMWKNLNGRSPILGALKRTSLSRHTCHKIFVHNTNSYIT